MKTLALLLLSVPLYMSHLLGSEHFYVTDNQGTVGSPGTFVSIVDLSTNTVVGYVDSNGFNLTHPIDIHFDDDGSRAFVVCDTANAVFIIDVSLGKVVGMINDIANPFDAPVIMEVSFSANKGYVANEAGSTGNRGSISVIDLLTDLVIGKVDDTLGPFNLPIGVGASDDGTKLLIANLGGHNVSAVDVMTDRVTGYVNDTVHPFVQPLFPAWSGSSKAYVSDLNNGLGGFVNVIVNNVVTGTVSTTGFPPFASPVNIVEGPDGTMYITDIVNNNVYEVDPTTDAVTHVLTGTFSYPLGISILSDNSTAYVANSVGNNISIVNLTTRMQTGIVNATSFPFFTPYQMQITGLVPPIPPTTTLLRPICIKGKQEANRFASQTELLNIISWCPSPTMAATHYNLYRNGILIESINANHPLNFEEQNVQKGVVITYSVTAVDSSGNESPAVTVSLP